MQATGKRPPHRLIPMPELPNLQILRNFPQRRSSICQILGAEPMQQGPIRLAVGFVLCIVVSTRLTLGTVPI